jgi:uracil permease
LTILYALKQAISGAQILCVAFGALILVPLLTGLNPALALLGAGIGTLLFQVCTRREVPVFLGSSFAFIGPVIYGIQTWGHGATLFGLFCAGFMYFIFAALIRWRGIGLVNRLFPPIVIGPVIIGIGLSVAHAACRMSMGYMGDKAVFSYNSALFLAGIALVTVIGISLYARGLLTLIPILVGILVGYTAAAFMGVIDFAPIIHAPWFVIPDFQRPEVNWVAAAFMLPVAIAPAIEHIGGIIAIGGVTGKDYTAYPGLHRTLVGDGLGVCVAACVGGPPITTYAEVTGAVMMTRNFNPTPMTWAAILAIGLAFLGKFNALLQSIPVPVMGGVMVLLFGIIASLGLKILVEAKTDFMNPRNLIIISLALTTGIGGLALHVGDFILSGVGLSSILAIVLNLILPERAITHHGLVEGQDI